VVIFFSTASSWHKVTPFGIRPLLNWIRREYGEYDIYITENGFSDYLGTVLAPFFL
jgi:beta-glucosidase/6-phospho-beta-glucosidase/beta-galactosidase